MYAEEAVVIENDFSGETLGVIYLDTLSYVIYDWCKNIDEGVTCTAKGSEYFSVMDQ